MRVMVLVKASPESEAGQLPTADEMQQMEGFNEELVAAGVMLAGEGLQRSAEGKRVRFEGNTTTVVDGPFTETKELVAGYWIWQVASLEEACEWLKRSPFGSYGTDTVVEVRRVSEASDFAEIMTPEPQANGQQLRAQVADRQQ